MLFIGICHPKVNLATPVRYPALHGGHFWGLTVFAPWGFSSQYNFICLIVILSSVIQEDNSNVRALQPYAI